MQTGEGAEGLLKYYYDVDGTRLAVESNGKVYYYKYNTTGDVISLMDEDFNDIAYYSYNAYGKPESVTDASGNDISQNSEHIANKNPFRYRGYYYDSETGLYYLQSRYYDPEIGRFINADGYVSTGQSILGTNMFAYCGNNPVNRVDHTGHFWSAIWGFVKTVVSEVGKAMGVMSPAYAGCGGSALVDGPLPFGDIVGLIGAALLTVGAIGYGIYQAARAPSVSIPKAKEKEQEKATPTTPPSSTVIYRYYSSKTENLSPRAGIDYDGLSFSTKPPRPGVSAVVTTIEQVNATGILTAIPNGGTHVTVIPTNGTVNQWMYQGQSSIWSQTLSLIVVEWDGEY